MGFEAKLVEAEHLASINRFERSNTLLYEVLSEDPNNGNVLTMIGSNFYQLSEYEKAKEFILNGLAQGNQIEASHCLLGLIHMELNELVQSEKHFLESLRLNPQNPRTLARYASLMLRTNHAEKGKRLLEEARRIDPEDEAVLQYWYDYSHLLEDLELQQDMLSDIVSSDEDEYTKLLNITRHHLAKENYREAYKAARDAFTMNPHEESVLKLLKELKILNSPFMWPIHLISKVGGPLVIWGALIAIMILLNALKLETLMIYVLYPYLAFCIYSWIAPPVIRKFYSLRYR